MKYILIGIFIIGLLAAAIFVFLPKKEATPELPSGPTMKINNTEIKLRLAQTTNEISRGLGGVAQLEENEGMLFLLPQKDTKPTFWMKDMLIDLDMIWINDDRIVDIHENVPAQRGVSDGELKLYSPKEKIDYILEVNAGFAAKNNIKVGDLVDLFNIN